MAENAFSGDSGMLGKLPPHNIDAEKSVLGGVLVKPMAFDEMATVLTGDDFFLPAHREIFISMMELDKKRQPIDVVSLGDELKNRGLLPRLEGGSGYLLTLANSVPTAENIGHYVRMVKEKATLRRLIGACAEIQSRAYGEFGNYEEFLDEAETQIFKVAQQNRRESFQPVGELMGEVVNELQTRSMERRQITGVPTGFTKMDEITAGLQPENLIIVAARPGVGKTTWAINVATHAALEHNIPVLIFSLEMSKVELMERMLAGEARIDSSRLRRGMIEYGDWKSHIYPAADRLSKAPILIDDSAAPNILELRAKARRFRGNLKYFPTTQGRPPLGLLVIDYLQLARGLGGKREDSLRARNRRYLARAEGLGQRPAHPGHRGFAAEPRFGKTRGQATPAFRLARVRRHRAGRRHDSLHPPRGDVRDRGGRSGARPSSSSARTVTAPPTPFPCPSCASSRNSRTTPGKRSRIISDDAAAGSYDRSKGRGTRCQPQAFPFARAPRRPLSHRARSGLRIHGRGVPGARR